MKVLQINAVYGYLSTGIIVEDLEKEIVKNGGTCLVAYQQASKEPTRGYKVGNRVDRFYHGVHTRVFGKQGYASRCATKRLIKWIEKEKPDIVHLHNLHSNYINFNLLCDALAKRNIATVITLHDCWYFTGKCSHYVYAGCDRWQKECGSCPQLKSEVPSIFFDETRKVLLDRTEHILKIKNLVLVGCSKWIAGEAKKSRLSSSRVEVVYNGVDTSVFTPHESTFREKHGIGNRFMIMGMADKWSNSVNRDAVDAIVKTFPDAAIVIVGCRQEHKAYFEEYKNIIPIGFVSDRSELSDIYASADVFVNLTRADTLPTVNMESICCGTPVVTFDVCGSPELVDTDSGVVVREDDIDALVGAISKIKAGECVFDAFEKQKKFDKNYCYGRYYDIYKTLL